MIAPRSIRICQGDAKSFIKVCCKLGHRRTLAYDHAAINNNSMAPIEINWKPSPRELKQFAGIWFPLACAVLCFAVYKATGTGFWPSALASIGAVLSIVAFLFPPFAQRLFVVWMTAVFPIGWTISHLLIGVIFFLLITPMGLVMRLFGRDTMGRKFEPQRESYWVPHQAPPDKQRYFRQY